MFSVRAFRYSGRWNPVMRSYAFDVCSQTSFHSSQRWIPGKRHRRHAKFPHHCQEICWCIRVESGLRGLPDPATQQFAICYCQSAQPPMPSSEIGRHKIPYIKMVVKPCMDRFLVYSSHCITYSLREGDSRCSLESGVEEPSDGRSWLEV